MTTADTLRENAEGSRVLAAELVERGNYHRALGQRDLGQRFYRAAFSARQTAEQLDALAEMETARG